MAENEVSVRELRNHTADVVRRVERGETLTLTVHRRPVADIRPHDPGPRWGSRETLERILREAPADRGLLADLDDTLGQTIDEL